MQCIMERKNAKVCYILFVVLFFLQKIHFEGWFNPWCEYNRCTFKICIFDVKEEVMTKWWRGQGLVHPSSFNVERWLIAVQEIQNQLVHLCTTSTTTLICRRLDVHQTRWSLSASLQSWFSSLDMGLLQRREEVSKKVSLSLHSLTWWPVIPLAP